MSDQDPVPAAKTARPKVSAVQSVMWLTRVVIPIAWTLFAAYQVAGFVLWDFKIDTPKDNSLLERIGLDATQLVFVLWAGALGGGINIFLAEGREYNSFMADNSYPRITLAETVWSAFRPALSLVVGVITVLFVRLGLAVFSGSESPIQNPITLALVSFFAGLSSIQYLQILAKRFASLIKLP